MRTLVILLAAISLASCSRRSTPEVPPPAPASQAASSPTASSQPVKASDLNSTIADRFLKRFPATYDYDEVLNDELVQKPLRELLGSEYVHLKDNLSVLRTPIDVVSGALALYGVRNDVAIREDAVLCISFHPLQVHVGIYSHYAMTIYSHTAIYEHLPRCIHQWVFMQTRDDMDQPPAQGNGEFTFALKVVPQRPSASAPAASSPATQSSSADRSAK